MTLVEGDAPPLAAGGRSPRGPGAEPEEGTLELGRERTTLVRAPCTYTVRVDLWNYEQVEPRPHELRRELWIQDLPDGVPHKLTLKMELVPRVEVGVVNAHDGGALDDAFVTLHKLPKGGAVFELGKGPRRSQLLTYLGEYALRASLPNYAQETTREPEALYRERWPFDGPLALSGSIATGGAVLAARAAGADFASVGSGPSSRPRGRG